MARRRFWLDNAGQSNTVLAAGPESARVSGPTFILLSWVVAVLTVVFDYGDGWLRRLIRPPLRPAARASSRVHS